ncbi:MAG TPA: VOC family protein [Candidatus Eisenbacteria bacterium]|jgi:catechol 2,3-dioxygenase-like lactoylglutathione lyase family enzyme
MAAIRYLVDDVDRAVTFYTTKLGFDLAERWGKPFAMVSRGDITLWLSGPESSAARPMPDGRKPVPGGWNRVVVEVKDLESRVAAMKREGVAFRNEIVKGPGGKQILIEDGCGNVVELFEPASPPE